MKRYLYLLFFTGLLQAGHIYAQGCSDAGFCTAGAMQAGHTVQDSFKTVGSVGLSITAGGGENGTLILAPQLEGTLNLGTKGLLEAKLPVNIASGNLGNHTGLGDLIVTYTYSFSQVSSSVRLRGTLGSRIGLSDASATVNGVDLPMPYQQGLGTTDIIAGIGVSCGRHLSFSGGYQQPILQYNRNGYLPPVLYPTMVTDDVYFASRQLNRRGDILLRAEGSWQWRKWSVVLGPLFIYHLGQDRVLLQNGSEVSLTGSEGATLNMAGALSYSFKKMKVELLGGTPLVVRDYRPDGLTRAWVTTLRITRMF